MRADAHGDIPVVRAGDPVRHAHGRGHDPGVRAGPCRKHRFAALFRQRAPVDEAVQLRHRRGHEDQTLVHGALLECEQSRYGSFIEGIAAESPDRFGRIGHDASAAQERRRLDDG